MERSGMERIMDVASGSGITAVSLQQGMRQETGATFRITHVRKLMHRFSLAISQRM